MLDFAWYNTQYLVNHLSSSGGSLATRDSDGRQSTAPAAAHDRLPPAPPRLAQRQRRRPSHVGERRKTTRRPVATHNSLPPAPLPSAGDNTKEKKEKNTFLHALKCEILFHIRYHFIYHVIMLVIYVYIWVRNDIYMYYWLIIKVIIIK